MRNSRLGFLIVTLVLLSGLGTACKKGRAAPWGSDDNHRPDRFQPLIEKRKIDILLRDATRQQSALLLFKSNGLGLLHESSPDKLQQDSATAFAALTETVRQVPEALRRTFGPKVADDLSKDFEFERTFTKDDRDRSKNIEPQKVECAHSACFVDVYFRSWRAYDGLNQLFATDQALPWNQYQATRYRSGRVAIEHDPEKRFLVTWALIFPLKSSKAEVAERTNEVGKKGGVSR